MSTKTYRNIPCEIIGQDTDQENNLIAEIVFLDEGPDSDSLLVAWDDVKIS